MAELANIRQGNGASFIYRENNSRYIGVQFSIEGRDLARAVGDAQKAVQASVKLPQGYYKAFAELHIEQGPLLERQKVALGIVTSIAAPAVE